MPNRKQKSDRWKKKAVTSTSADGAEADAHRRRVGKSEAAPIRRSCPGQKLEAMGLRQKRNQRRMRPNQLHPGISRRGAHPIWAIRSMRCRRTCRIFDDLDADSQKTAPETTADNTSGRPKPPGPCAGKRSFRGAVSAGVWDWRLGGGVVGLGWGWWRLGAR